LIQEISDESLKRLGVASETIHTALVPIVERQLDKSLGALDIAENEFKQQKAIAEITVLRKLMKQLESNKSYAKD